MTFARCAAADTVPDACEGLVDDLHDHWLYPSVYLLVDGRLRCQAARGYFQVVDGFLPGTGVIGQVVASGEPVIMDDVTQVPHFIAAMPGIRSEACVPVHLGGAVVGAVNVEDTAELPPGAAATLGAAAEALAERIHALGGLPPVPLAQRVARIVIGLTALTDVEQIEQRTVDAAVQLSGMTSAALSRVDDQGVWSVSWTEGPLQQSLSHWTSAEHQVVAGWVAAGTSSHFPGGAEIPPSYDFLLRAGVRSIAVQPLVAGGRVTGLLTTADANPVPHDSTVGAVIELLAGQAAASLGMAAALQELARRATQDSLTGLLNSAAFSQDLQKAASYLDESRADGIACLLVDVDDFKHVNDTYGHLAGDRLLVALAEELRRELRDGDVIYRIGGDEFAVLLRDTSSTAAEAVGHRLVEAARRVRTTVSVGTALLETTAEDVRLRADRALYLAKADGRDQARFAASPEPPR